MRTILLSFTCAILLASSANAQSFKKGTNVLSGLIGIGSSLGSLGSFAPAFSVNFERGSWLAGKDGVVSIGGYVGRTSSSYKVSNSAGTYEQKWSYTIVGVRSAYHYTALDDDNLDVYGGLMLSYNVISYNINGTGYYSSSSNTVGNPYNSIPGVTAYVGGRYYFAPRIAVNAEVGYGVSYLNAGISLKF